ncbi:ImmA/IrrE family metallo-endopeptidase [Hymenobacter sp. HSC-4F20]|uniref:ImmA/IrrE family metallo-endopeptidase n=1 Tax=Hymenobacter sp. HSC-4F20 TaxID=2864135 RepID=UPI0038F7D00D
MILYNDSNSLARQESDIMHELAHIICEHPGDCLQLNADIALRQHNDSHEEEAKWLGATLQVPDQGLYQLVRAGHTTERIAEIYGCSIEMAIYRRRITAVDRRLSYIKPKPQF